VSFQCNAAVMSVHFIENRVRLRNKSTNIAVSEGCV
jgi:hypothetical protein